MHLRLAVENRNLDVNLRDAKGTMRDKHHLAANLGNNEATEQRSFQSSFFGPS